MMSTERQLPIDRGWAWVITFASFGIYAFISGALKNRGIILVELQQLFPDTSATTLIWILNINVIIDKVLGPVNGMILARTSNRTLSMIGSCIMTASLIGFAYSPSIEYMFAVYSIYGWGSGMSTLSCLTAFQPYFDKKKALSSGITGSGSGAGALLLSALLRVFFDNYSFSGAILLYAGLCLQTLVLASLLRPFSYYDRYKSKVLPQDSPQPATVESFVKNKPVERRNSLKEKKSNLALSKRRLTRCSSLPNNLNRISTDHPKLEANFVHESTLCFVDNISPAFEQDTPGSKRLEVQAKDVKTSFNWRLAYNPRCILMGISIVLYLSGLTSSYTCIPPLGVQTGISKQLVSILLAACGALEIPMRILNGWLADKKIASAYAQLTLYMIITGVAALLGGIISNIAGIVVMLLGFAATGTSIFSLLPIVCGELYGKENVQSGMAFLFVYEGLAVAVASFSSGGIYEKTGRWESVFYYNGVSMICGGLVMLSTVVMVYCTNKRKQCKVGSA